MTEEIFYEEEIEHTHIISSDENIASENIVEESLEVVSEEISAVSSEEISEEIPETIQEEISEEISSSLSDEIVEVTPEIESEEISSEPSDEIVEVAPEIELEEILSESSDEIVEVVSEIESEEDITATREELKPVMEALLFVADEPLPFKQLCKVLGDINEDDVRSALNELVEEYDGRNSGLEVREIAGGWRISTRPQNHEFIRKYLRSRPSARLSLPALETLAVIAYKQPVTIPEILEIRGVSSSSAIKTLLEKRLIVTKGRKETVGRPMMYGTSKEFLIQFGLKDLTELPSIEDFEDLAQ